MSEVSLSGMSEADRMLFTVLSNTERVDLSRFASPGADSTPRIEELPLPRSADPRDASAAIETHLPPLFEEAPTSPPVARHATSDEQERRRDEERQREAAAVAHEEERRRHQEDELRRVEEEERRRRTEEEEAMAAAAERARKAEAEGSATGHAHEGRQAVATAPLDPVEEARMKEEEEMQKRTLLLDLQQLTSHHGVKLTKEWTMDDRIEDMMLEMRRHTLAMDERSNVAMMRDGLRLFVTGIEMANARVGLLDLEGWSVDVSRDLQKQDINLSKLYRKYWRRGSSNSPEMSIAMSLFGSMGMHHLRRTMSKSILRRNSSQPGPSRPSSTPYADDSSDDEATPPN